MKEEMAEAAEFYKKFDIQGPMFNNFDVSDDMIYYLFPETIVLIDARPEFVVEKNPILFSTLIERFYTNKKQNLTLFNPGKQEENKVRLAFALKYHFSMKVGFF